MFARKPAPHYAHLAEMRADVLTTCLTSAAYDALIDLADAGHDVDAYTSPSGRWVLWVRSPLAWQEARFTPREWEAFYRLYLFAHYSGALPRALYAQRCREIADVRPNGQLLPPELRDGQPGAYDAAEHPEQEVVS